MNSLRDRMINEVIRIEGGYVDDPSDSGGETNYGITVAVARAYGFMGHMKDLPIETAFQIYVEKYWDSLKGDEIVLISELIAEELIDTGINMGISRAGKFLQRALNVLNNRAIYYSDITVDGQIGSVTVYALRAYMHKRDNDDETLAKVLNCLQGAKYVSLAEKREKDEKFISGWFRNRVKI